jgi:hypothetical protein
MGGQELDLEGVKTMRCETMKERPSSYHRLPDTRSTRTVLHLEPTTVRLCCRISQLWIHFTVPEPFTLALTR